MMLIRSLAGFTVIIAAMAWLRDRSPSSSSRASSRELFAGFSPDGDGVGQRGGAARQGVGGDRPRAGRPAPERGARAGHRRVRGLAPRHPRGRSYATAVLCAVSLIALIFLF
jgi:hypothetical protein